MKTILLSFLLLAASMLQAQLQVSDSSLLIRPLFKLGDQKTYKVKVSTKAQPFWAEQEFKIQFEVLDTTDGYLMSYSVQTLKAQDKKLNTLTIKARTIDGLKVLYETNRQGSITRIVNADAIKERLNQALDYYTFDGQLSKGDAVAVKHLRLLLQTPYGFLSFLEPLQLFENAYGRVPFRNRKDFSPAVKRNLVGTTPFPGSQMAELKKVNWVGNEAIVQLRYMGNREQAAKIAAPLTIQAITEATGKEYHMDPMLNPAKMDTDYEYRIALTSGWLTKVYVKDLNLFVQKVVTKTTMELVTTDTL